MSNILILDGGLGTSLEQKYNVQFDDTKPLWSSHLLLNDQETLRQCQKDFGDVPVDIILTATYQLSLEIFEEEKLGQGTIDLSATLDDAVRIAEEAKRQHAQVALSIGPYGATMRPSQEYSGNYGPDMNDVESLRRWHQARLKSFVASVVNFRRRVAFVALETIPRVDEIKALRLAMASSSDLSSSRFWISCLFPGEDGLLPDGTPAEDAVRAMFDPEIAGPVPWAVGINCTKVWKLGSLLRQYESAIARMLAEGKIDTWPTLVLYPDGTNGEVYNTVSKQWVLPDGVQIDSQSSWEEQLASVVRETQKRGNWPTIVVGGCCMASAEHIKRLREVFLAG